MLYYLFDWLQGMDVPGARLALDDLTIGLFDAPAQMADAVSRKLGKDSLVSDPAKAAEQAVRMVMEQVTGEEIPEYVEPERRIAHA